MLLLLGTFVTTNILQEQLYNTNQQISTIIPKHNP